MRLESQLAALDRGVGDARAEQIRRYEEAAARQQAELDRVSAQARRLGCQGGGFFLFGGGQSPQCDQINAQVQRLRINLDRILAGLRQVQASGHGREEQRRAILAALADNDCGPQYRSAARPRGFFQTLFGVPSEPVAEPEAPRASNFKTLCVRTCDGFYFPISFSASPARFPQDERICQRACPAAEVALYAHRSQGEDVARAVSIAGRPYTELPNAFRYRREYDAACTCKSAGQSWAEAVSEDLTLAHGDIVVTEERAKAMSQPKAEPPPGQRPDPGKKRSRRGKPPSAEASLEPPAEPTASAAAPSEPPRAVGPQFYR